MGEVDFVKYLNCKELELFRILRVGRVVFFFFWESFFCRYLGSKRYNYWILWLCCMCVEVSIIYSISIRYSSVFYNGNIGNGKIIF